MKEVEDLVYSRMTGDTEPVNGLVALLDNTSKMIHAFQNIIPEVPYLTFYTHSTIKGELGGNFQRSIEVFIQFNVYAVNYLDILSRLRKLFDGYRFDVPSNYADVGQVRGLWDNEGPDGYDETLEVPFKTVRIRFFVTPKAWNPIAA